jgi:hypothetical protein
MENKVPNITMSQLDRMVPYMLRAEGGFQPLGLIGAPATGKTQYFQTRFREHMADFHGVQIDDIGMVIEKIGQAEDAAAINGLTIPTKLADGTIATVKGKPSLLKRIEDTGKEYGVVLLDEAPQAPMHVVGSLGDTFNRAEHKVGDWDLPQGWVVVFTGNRVEDRSGSRMLPAHMLTRVVMYNLIFDANGWVNYAEETNVNPIIVGVVRSEMAHFADAVPEDYGPYFTPRSAVQAGKHLDAFMDSDEFDGATIPSHINLLLTANVGSGVARAIGEYVRFAENVPTGNDIIADPTGAMVPDDSGMQLMAASRAITAVNSSADAEAALQYLVRLRPDLQVSKGAQLLRMANEREYTLDSDLANAFSVKYNEFLHLTFNDSGDNA